MKERRRALGSRDQHVSPFSATLLRLCDATCARGAAVVDGEGETVDYAGSMTPFDIKVTAAEWALVFSLVKGCRSRLLANAHALRVRASRKSFAVYGLADGYALVLELVPHAFHVSGRGLSEAMREICIEAGLPPSSLPAQHGEQWARVEVRCQSRRSRRPHSVWVDGAWHPVEVLGRWNAGLRGKELGYRARLPSGAEFTLVREPFGRWYADGPLLV